MNLPIYYVRLLVYIPVDQRKTLSKEPFFYVCFSKSKLSCN